MIYRYSFDYWVLFARRTSHRCCLFGPARDACFVLHVLVVVDGFQLVQHDGVTISTDEYEVEWKPRERLVHEVLFIFTYHVLFI